MMPFAPAMNTSKFDTLQQRRVNVVVEYTEFAGWGVCAADALHAIKSQFPDVRTHLLSRRRDRNVAPLLTIRVDSMLIASSRCPGSVFLSLRRIGLAVERCRRLRRPAVTVYGASQNGEVDELPAVEMWTTGSGRMEQSDGWGHLLPCRME